MKIKIIAIDTNEGWAFIVKEEKIVLLRPPYDSKNQIEVSRKIVENAIHLYGFEKSDMTLNSISEAITYLKEEYIKSKEIQGIGIPSSEELKGLLKYATDEVLLEYLDKAKKELIPSGKLEAAESIALELMNLERVNDNPEMLKMINEILKICVIQIRGEKIKELEEEISADSKEAWPNKFPNAVKTYPIESIIKIQKDILKRRQLLPVVS